MSDRFEDIANSNTVGFGEGIHGFGEGIHVRIPRTTPGQKFPTKIFRRKVFDDIGYRIYFSVTFSNQDISIKVISIFKIKYFGKNHTAIDLDDRYRDDAPHFIMHNVWYCTGIWSWGLQCNQALFRYDKRYSLVIFSYLHTFRNINPKYLYESYNMTIEKF